METILIFILLIMVTVLIFKNFDILKIILNYIKDLMFGK